MPPTASTRWSPTPEQLMILEELYRRGIRTPTASQILHITTHLSLYGKIEGKNVFYWFQNHKARDRQKLRRKLLRQQQQQQHQQQQQQQQTLHHDLFHQIESPPLLQLPPLNNQTQFLPQGGDSSNQMIMGDYGWKMIDSSSSKRMELEKPNTIYGQDWMMMMTMMMMDTNTPCCNSPPKTLQLFPITTKALKDECMDFSLGSSTFGS